MNKRAAAVLSLALSVALAASAACEAGESEEQQAVREAVEETYAAMNADDVDGFLEHVTSGFLAESFTPPPTEAELRENGLHAAGEPDTELSDFGDVDVSGDSATVEVWQRENQGAERTRLTLVKEGDAWLLDGLETLKVDTPEGATEVALETVDNRYTIEGGRDVFPAGDLAFQVTNAGAQRHNFFVLSLPSGVTVREAFEVRYPTDVGARYTGLFGDIEPGADGTWLLEDLEPGRYGYFCWAPDPVSGTPHAYDGMWGEFTVE